VVAAVSRDISFSAFSDSTIVPQKDCLDHIAEYTASGSGAWEILYVVDQALSYVRLLPSLSELGRSLIGRVSDAVNTIGLALSIPAVFSDCVTLRNSVSRLYELKDLPTADPFRHRKILLGSKAVVLDALMLTNNFTYIPYLLEHLKIQLFEARHLPIFEGIYNGTSIILDGVEFVEEGFKINQYYHLDRSSMTPEQKQRIEEKQCLSWMVVAKDVSSVAISAISIIGLVFGLAIEGVGVLAIGFLVLSSFWLTIKIVSYFYNQLVIEPHAAQSLLASTA
jgi:hypothetical protein